MAAISAAFIWLGRDRDGTAGAIRLSSPVSLWRVLKFASLFLALEVIGTLAQRYFGIVGFLAVSLLGGLVSSASTTATAASLAISGKITGQTAGMAVVLTSIASALINLPLVRQQSHRPKLLRRLTLATFVMVAVGIGLLLTLHVTMPH